MKISIIGGGLTGCLTALELADHGHNVSIFDRAPALLSRASKANEGKIHLGYVYAADTSFRTAERLIDDALRFRPILERWMTSAAFEACLYDQFTYVVPRKSSLDLDQITHHFSRVENHLRTRLVTEKLAYLGDVDCPGFTVCSSTTDAAPAFLTLERGVWPHGISAAIFRCLELHPRIEIHLNAGVNRVIQMCGKWLLEFEQPESAVEGPFDVVVNAAWAERRMIDQRSGFETSGSWFTRYKFGVMLENASAHLGCEIPRNTTATSGPFGDCVYYPQDDSLYCSWYPVGMCFSTLNDNLEQPSFPDERRDELMRQTWAGCVTFAPSLNRLTKLPSPLPARILGDFIVAKGRSDIVDPQSGLHHRSDHSSLKLGDGYWSIETGKYTSAPRCAVDCAASIIQEG